MTSDSQVEFPLAVTPHIETIPPKPIAAGDYYARFLKDPEVAHYPRQKYEVC